jgi:hypothetical protein
MNFIVNRGKLIFPSLSLYPGFLQKKLMEGGGGNRRENKTTSWFEEGTKIVTGIFKQFIRIV